jgi:hypothetical protein
MHCQKAPDVSWEQHLRWLNNELRHGLMTTEDHEHWAYEHGYKAKIRADVAEVEAIIAAEAAWLAEQPTFEEALEQWIGDLVAFHDSLDRDHARKPVAVKGR